MKKPVFYTEIAYFLALALLAAGTSLTAYGGLGMSMVVAPAYILHLKLSQFFPFFTFGVAGYTLQAVVLLVMMLLLRKAKLVYLLSFVAAVCYSFVLDGAMALVAFLPQNTLLQIFLYIAGTLLCCAGLGLLFSAYLPPEAYELCVKELAAKFGKPVSLMKTIYDCCSLVLSIALSLLFFGTIRGIGIGTVACAFLYGFLIRLFQNLYRKQFRFTDRFPLRKYFEETKASDETSQP